MQKVKSTATRTSRMCSLSNADCSWVSMHAVGYHAIEHVGIWRQLVTSQQAHEMRVPVMKLDKITIMSQLVFILISQLNA